MLVIALLPISDKRLMFDPGLSILVSSIDTVANPHSLPTEEL